jgi:hypothetical protein
MKKKSECEAEFFTCNFKCGLTNKKEDTFGLAMCMNTCQKERTQCLKNATE